MKKIKLAAVLGIAATALAMGATAASAQTVKPHPVAPLTWHATTYLADRPDGGNPNDWADDYFTRVLTITETGSTGTAPDVIYDYTATVTDKGYFTTIKGVDTPNQAAPYTGDLIKSKISGPMQGYDDFTFTANSLPSSAPNLGVTTYENDGGADPAGEHATSDWYALAFPSTAVVGSNTTPPLNNGVWSWSYHATVKTTTLKPYWSWTYRHHHWVRVLRWLPVTHYSTQHWVDASANNGGNAPADGNISG